jgi:hypothetical protein
VVPQSGWGDGPSQGLGLSARTGDWAPWCRPARVRPSTFQRSLSRRVLKSFSAGLPGVFAAWEACLASTARLDQSRPMPRPLPRPGGAAQRFLYDRRPNHLLLADLPASCHDLESCDQWIRTDRS